MKTRLFLSLCCVLAVMPVFGGTETVTVNPGYNQIANPLDDGAGDLLNNIMLNSTPALPDGCVLMEFLNGSAAAIPWEYAVYSQTANAWTPNIALVPGDGAFLLNPSASSFTLTFTGTSLPARTSYPFTAGLDYYMLGAQHDVVTTTDYTGMMGAGSPPDDGTMVFEYKNPPGGYTINDTYAFGSWADGGPTIGVGQSIWILLPGIYTTAPNPPLYLNSVSSSGSLCLNWYGSTSTLQYSDDLITWQNVPGTVTSPYCVPPFNPPLTAGGARYYRLVQ
jgi:hypothetical protein